MKTLDEVIEAMERCSIPHYFDCKGCPYEDDDAEVGCRSDDRDADALHYLKHLQEYYEMSREHHEPNPPLSWAELRTMEGKPVWTDCIAKRWIVIADFRENENGAEYLIATDGGRFSAKEQGNLWQAYQKERG